MAKHSKLTMIGLAEDAEAEKSYLTPDIEPEAIGAFFRAAAGLYRAKPWEVVPNDTSLLSLTIEELGIRDAAVSVIGQLGTNFGLVMFSGAEDFEAHLEAADALERGEKPSMPPQFSINFERRDGLPSKLYEEIAEHRWEVAAPDAHPWFFALEDDMVVRPSTPKDVTTAEAIALAFTEALNEKRALAAAWDGGEPFVRTLSVRTHAGQFDVKLGAPYESASELRPLADVFADLQALGERGEEVDPDELHQLKHQLVRHFLASPEAKGLTSLQSYHFITDVAANYFDATIATLGPDELGEIVFEIIPEKLSIEAAAARSIIEETRALYTFLKREFALPQADACLEVLGGDAVAELKAALSDSSNFGMAKSMVMSGSEAGFDMTSKAGIDAAMLAMQTGLFPSSIRPPAFGAARGSSKAQTKAKKQQRKATRKARRRNR